MVWGALLGVSLQARISALDPHEAVRAYGVLAAAGAAVAAIAQIAAGALSDRRRARGGGRAIFYAAGITVACGALFWFYLAPSLTQLGAALLVLQFGMNLAVGPYQTTIPELFPEDEWARASGWMAGLQSGGNACGALIAGLIASGAVDAAAACALLAISAAIAIPHIRRLTPREPGDAPPVSRRSFADLFVSRALVYAGLYTMLGYLYFFVALIAPAHARVSTGLLLLLFLLAGAAGAAFGAKAAAALEVRLSANAGGAIFVVALVVLIGGRGMASAIAAAAIGGAGWGWFLTADWTLGCAFLPRRALAFSMGIWNLALLIPQMAAPLAATAAIALARASGERGVRTAFALAALETAAGLFWIWRLPGGRVKASKHGKPARAIGQGEL